MSAVTDASIIFATQKVAIYIGIPVLAAGIIGGVLNIIVFLSLKTFRQTPCAFFLTVMSFVNIGQLLTSCLSRIMISGFSIDWTEGSVGYCKFRNFCLQFCALVSYTCMCLTTIDQFLATSRGLRWQQLFNIKRAYVLCTLFFIIWLVHGIPTLMWYNLIPISTPGRMTCMITHPTFQKYITYGYLLVFTGILPICTTILFGSLAYWHVRQIPYRVVPLVRRELDKQLTTMVLVQVSFSLFVIIPYTVVLMLLYTLDFTNRSINFTTFNLISTTVGMIYYLYFAAPFYIYICVSKRFRQQLIHVLTDIHVKWRKQKAVGINQVTPEGVDTSR